MAFKVKRPGMAKPSAERLAAGSMMSGRGIEVGWRPGTAVQVFVGAPPRKPNPATIGLTWLDSCTVPEIPTAGSAEFLNLPGQFFHTAGVSASVTHMIDQNRRNLFVKHFRDAGTVSPF